MESFHQLKQEQIKEIFKSQSANVQGFNIYRKDYQSLLPDRWLSSEAINTISQLLHQKFKKQFKKFLTEKETIQDEKYIQILDPYITTMIMRTNQQDQQQTLRALEVRQFFNSATRYLLMPINTSSKVQGLGQHWFLIVYQNGRYRSLQQKYLVKTPNIIYIYDSIKNSCSLKQANVLQNKIKLMVKLFHKEQIQIKIQKIKEIPLQYNSCDCGIFTIAYIECFINKILKQKYHQQIEFNCQKMLQNSTQVRNRYRQMMQQLLTKK